MILSNTAARTLANTIVNTAEAARSPVGMVAGKMLDEMQVATQDVQSMSDLLAMGPVTRNSARRVAKLLVKVIVLKS